MLTDTSISPCQLTNGILVVMSCLTLSSALRGHWNAPFSHVFTTMTVNFPPVKKKLQVFPVGRLLSPTFCNADLFHLSFIFVGWVLFSGNEHGRTTKPSNFGVQYCWHHFLVNNSLCVFPFGLFAQCEKMLPSKKTEHFQVSLTNCIILHFYMCYCFHIH